MTSERAGFRSPGQTEAPFTVSQIEAIRKGAIEDGHREGYTQGLKAGYEAGLEAGVAEQKIELARIHQLLASLQQPFRTCQQQLLEQLQQLTQQIAQTFLKHELQTPDLLEVLVKKSVEQLKELRQKVVLHANTANAKLLESHLTAGLNAKQWSVQINPQLSDSHVYLEAGSGRIEIDLEQALQDYLESVAQSTLPLEAQAPATATTPLESQAKPKDTSKP